MKRQSKIKYGFTLIELIIVMAILGILAGGLIGNFMSSAKKGRDSQRKSDLKQMQNALEAFSNDNNGLYPNASSGQINGVAWGGEFNNPSVPSTIYMKSLPEDPKPLQNNYYYFVTTGNVGYKLYACLENDQDSDYNASGYSGTNCGSCMVGSTCNYGVASSNETP